MDKRILVLSLILVLLVTTALLRWEVIYKDIHRGSYYVTQQDRITSVIIHRSRMTGEKRIFHVSTIDQIIVSTVTLILFTSIGVTAYLLLKDVIMLRKKKEGD